ncbi:AraC family transcriptional regulator [Streptomyces beijiangensis]|uniref:Helix-turn-helix transcriptional regulator n=1 Tax=Streptomyces beijiangensis TaxID=163361 RepID=A0A939FCD9_9ACTN|nr:AraC family transcriptional regulator [Streptomyces beijiangensis]MBO0514857.1 helix-turn-helix transcriptional regulator [Streptomyces beijiangensis]
MLLFVRPVLTDPVLTDPVLTDPVLTGALGRLHEAPAHGPPGERTTCWLAPADAAASAGFADQAHFNRRFKRAYGITPAVCQRAARRRGRPSLDRHRQP